MPVQKCTLFTEFSANNCTVSQDFSLVGYKNDLYLSNDIKKIYEFYESFKDANSLISWMRERSKGKTSIYEYPGSKDITVVIPTTDVNSELAKSCRNSIYRGLQIIFVESGLPRDNYFNYAHSCNVGIKRALELGSKWIIVSNDDMEKIDDVSQLTEELNHIEQDTHVIWTEETKTLQHSFNILKTTFLFRILINLSAILCLFSEHSKIKTLSLFKKYDIYLTPKYANSNSSLFQMLLYKGVETHKVAGPFAIYNSNFIRNVLDNSLFDETFINGFEDTWLGINIDLRNIKCGIINFKINPIGGVSLGKGYLRYLRNFANLALYNSYVYNGVNSGSKR